MPTSSSEPNQYGAIATLIQTSNMGSFPCSSKTLHETIYEAHIKLLVLFPIIYLFQLSILYLTFTLWLMLSILDCITIKVLSGVLKNFSSKHAKTKNLFIEYAVDS